MSERQMKEFDPTKLPVAKSTLEETPLYNKIDVSSIVFRQIERTNMSALQGEEFFASNVRLLMSHVPSHKRDEILERSEEYSSTVKSYQYKFFCGVPLGTVEDPVNGSPFEVEEEVIDWHKLYEICLDILEECGITWKFEKWTIEVGVVEKEKKEIPPPTPVFAKELTEEISNEKVSPEKRIKIKRKRPCAVCGDHCQKGTSVFYGNKPNRRQVHKNECLEVAKLKWKNN